MRPRRIVLIGYGAIASELGAMLARSDPAPELALLLRPGSPSRATAPDWPVLATPEDCAAFGADLVVEAADHDAVRDLAPRCLALGLPVLVASVGAPHDAALLARLRQAAVEGGSRLLLPSGALGGLDYVRAVRGASNLRLRYESRKPPSAWRGELAALGHDAGTLDGPVTLFSGDARAAAAAYPQNLNVAAALALAGPGFERVAVAVVCDPAATGNTHTVEAASDFGTMRIVLANRPAPANPKTSALVAASLAAAIAQFFSPIQML